MKMSKTVNVIVNDGVVIAIEGLPEDWDVAITDVDDNPESWEARNNFDLDIAEIADLKEQLRKFSPPQENEDE